MVERLIQGVPTPAEFIVRRVPQAIEANIVKATSVLEGCRARGPGGSAATTGLEECECKQRQDVELGDEREFARSFTSSESVDRGIVGSGTAVVLRGRRTACSRDIIGVLFRYETVRRFFWVMITIDRRYSFRIFDPLSLAASSGLP